MGARPQLLEQRGDATPITCATWGRDPIYLNNVGARPADPNYLNDVGMLENGGKV